MKTKHPTDRQRDAEIVAHMKRASRKEGLWAEVREGYLYYRRSGDNPAEAAWCSLYDWDI